MKQSTQRNVLKRIRQSLIFTNDQLIPFVICFIGTVIEITDLLTIYFTFQTMTSVEVYSPDNVILPAISICHKYDLDEDLIREKIPRFNGSFELNKEDIRFNLTINELNEVTSKPKDFIHSCKVANTSFTNDKPDFVDCFQVEPVQINLDAHRKCFTLFFGEQSSFTYSRVLFTDIFIVKLQLNTTVTNHPYFQMIVHDHDQEVTSNRGSPETVLLDTHRFSDFVLTYYTEQIIAMGKPYSNCIDYFALYGQTKHDLIKKCIFNSIYEDYGALDDEILVRLPLEHNDTNFIRGVRTSRYRSACERNHTELECTTKSFQLILLRSLQGAEKAPGGGIISIELGYPIGMQTTVTMVPKQDRVEYFCYMASMINLWLEISVVGVVSFTFKKVRQMAMKLIVIVRKKIDQ
uniref:Uncharacterized protein n=1 Tax=Tetranychus urticae TaxID=32264 RepID=T1K2G9_TETUR